MNSYAKLLFLCSFFFSLFFLSHTLEASSTGSIQGIVANRTTHAPISGAKVELRRCNHIIAITTTASDGTFSFTHVKAGEYCLQASASNYENRFTGCRVHIGRTQRVKIYLTPTGGALTGQVTNTTYPGPAINGAIVSVIRGSLIVAQTTTNPSGFYTFSDLSPGCYKVAATASGFQNNLKGSKIHKGSTTTVNLPLQTNSGAISGTVKNMSSTPIPDADISLFDGPHLIATTTTNASGFYNFPDLAPGHFNVEAIAEGYQSKIVGASVTIGNTTTVNFMLESDPGTILGTVRNKMTSMPIDGAIVSVYKGPDFISFSITDSKGYYEVPGLVPDHYEVYASADTFATSSIGATVQADESTTVNFYLDPLSGTIAGTVTAAVSTLPIVGATVEIYDGDDLIANTLTDDSGNYNVDGLAPGNYTVVISAPTYQTNYVGASVASQQTTIVNAALQLLSGSIAGTVSDSITMIGIPGALVEVYDNLTHVGKGTTDATGNYTISGIPPGNYTVVASAYHYRSQTVGASVSASVTTTVDFILELDPGTLEGTVTALKTGLPISGASVRVFKGSILIHSVLTDLAGHYQIAHIFPGQYDVNAEATDFQTKTSGVQIIDNSISTVDFALITKPGTLEGKITDALNSNPIAGASIELYYQGIFIGSTLSDPQGNYSLKNLTPQTDTCVITAPNYQDKIITAAIIANQTTIANVTLNPFPGSVSGNVQDNTSTPIANALVTIYMENIAVDSTLTDSMGNYTLTGLAPDSYTLIVEAETYRTASQGVQIVSNTTQTENFTLFSNPGTIKGTVRDALTSKPIGGVSVSVYDDSILIAVTQTDPLGFYEIPDLAPGDYTLVAEANSYQIDSTGASVVAGNTITVNFALQLNPGTLKGNVKVASSSTVLPGIIIQVYQTHTLIASTITDSSGNYTILNLAPDDYDVVAQSNAGYQSETGTATIVSGKTTTLNFQLQSNSGSFAGTVTDTTPTPLAGVLVSVYDGDILINSTLTDSAGHYSIDGLAPGIYTLTAEFEGLQLGVQTGSITLSVTTIVNFTLQPNPHTVSGVVTDADTGDGISGATVSLFSGSTFIAYATTDSTGHYAIENLGDGNYTLEATDENYTTATASITISGADITQNFALVPIPLNPTNVTGEVVRNKFLTQTDRTHQITWTPSTSPDVVSYRIYRNGQLVKTVPASGPYIYEDHSQSKSKTVTYTIVTVNSFGQTSSGVSVILK